jgi:hypothetical protein
MKFVSSKLKQASIINQNFAKENSNEALGKNENKLNKKDSFVIFCENLKDTPIYLCICCERLNFF